MQTSLANPRYAIVSGSLAFLAICGYYLGCLRQIGADALLAKETPQLASFGWVSVLRLAPENRPNLGNRVGNQMATFGNFQ